MVFDERKLLLNLIKLIAGGWISQSQFERFASDFLISEGQESIYFYTGILKIIRELPLKVFTDDANRLAIIDAAQSALDASIEKEETKNMSQENEEKNELGK